VHIEVRVLPRRSVAVAAVFVALTSLALAQTPNELLSGPKPPDAPADWKRFVGVYEYSNNGRHKHSVIILERNQRPYMRSSSGPDKEIHFDLTSPYDFGQGYRRLGLMFVPDPAKGSWSYEIVEQPGAAPYFTYLMESYVRTDAGVDPAHFFRITRLGPWRSSARRH